MEQREGRFSEANLREKNDRQPELVPFWCLPNDEGIKIERIIPMLISKNHPDMDMDLEDFL